MTKTELADWLKDEEREWEVLLDRIGRAGMEQPGVNGGWSMKDLLAHLTGWHRWQLARFQAAARHEPQPAPIWPVEFQSDDEINAWIHEAYRRRSLAEVLEETQQVFQQMRSVLEGLPDDVKIETIEPAYYLVWLDGQRYQPGEFFDHYRDDHQSDVLAWREQAEKRE